MLSTQCGILVLHFRNRMLQQEINLHKARKGCGWQGLLLLCNYHCSVLYI